MGIFAAARQATETARRTGSRSRLGARPFSPAAVEVGDLGGPRSPEALRPGSTAPTVSLSLSRRWEPVVDEIWIRISSAGRAEAAVPQQAYFVAHWAPGDGATTFAAALAVRAASLERDRSFCLVDFDASARGLSRLTRLGSESGICNVLAGSVPVEDALAGSLLPNLLVLPAGSPAPPRPAGLLAQECRNLCEELQRRFNYVVVDMPGLRDHAGQWLWCAGLGKSVHVARAGRSRYDTVARSLETLGGIGLEQLGVVLNA